MAANDNIDWDSVLADQSASNDDGAWEIDESAQQEEWLKATASLYSGPSVQGGIDIGPAYRLDPRGVVADLTSGTTSLLTSAQYGLTADLTPAEVGQTANLRAQGLAAYSRDLQALVDDPALRDATGKIATDYFARGGTEQKHLWAQISQAAGILQCGNPENAAVAANLASSLDIIHRSPFAVAMLAVTLSQDRDMASNAVDHLSVSSDLDYKGGKAWNFAAARDLASGFLGSAAGFVQAGSAMASRAWTRLQASVPDVRGNPFLADQALSRGAKIPKLADSPDAPLEPYNRRKHYGYSPTAVDRKALNAGPDEVVDHDPPLVRRYYEGDPNTGELPGWQMNDAQRRESANDRSRMAPQPSSESDVQGAESANYSKQQKKRYGL